ncbi:PKD domain-containing protein [Frankia sp. Mgl5]|uniref:PKD domain-containing protein n=1 Tax=Frankia sp. Mgl5 TaxID=2933793 RepID=UPI00200D0BA8|nr:PKD domain-containing protein [Frankia sp. Mgl5]MCK9928878.1 PKD domain-containing protein [Frankia sp. Mgl5]
MASLRHRTLYRPKVTATLLTIVAVAVAASCSSDEKAAAAKSPPPTKADAGHSLKIDSKPLSGPVCKTGEGGTLFVTTSCGDPLLNRPYVDKDERRTVTDKDTGVTVGYRYVHGGFRESKGKFSFYFPSEYQGRFFQPTYPTVSVEDAAPNDIAFAISNNAYLVTTNNGGGLPQAGEIGGVRVNAAAAKFSRTVAAQVYEDSARSRGYIYGASGGAYQTLGALENSENVWDGGVPMVPGTPNAIPSSQTVSLLGLRVLHDKLPQIVDAMEPGGSGKPYSGLTDEQQAVLREVTRMGFPPRGWWDYKNMNTDSFEAVAGGVRILDPTYADDFWTKPGYAGTDPASSVSASRIQAEADVSGITGSPVTGLTLSSVPQGDLTGVDLVVLTGAAAGKTIPFVKVSGTEATFGNGADTAVTGALKPGDRVRLDNSWFLAMQYYQRYQVPSKDMYGWNQYRDANGKLLYPQRPILAGPTFASAASGGVPTGKFHGKIIMLASLLDTLAFPWPADWYHQQVKSYLGAETDSNYRLWYMDNAWHGPTPTRQESTPDKGAETHVVGYWGELQQALLDLDAWVAQGTPPPPSSAYTVDGDSQVRLPASADERHGVQPVVNLKIDQVGSRDMNTAVRVDAGVGQEVTFALTAEAPSGTGKIVGVEWDFAGTGEYADRSTVDQPDHSARLTASHIFSQPGTYFPTVRVTSERNGDPKTPFGLVKNLGRVRVIVK